jgi:hypothetical protein
MSCALALGTDTHCACMMPAPGCSGDCIPGMTLTWPDASLPSATRQLRTTSRRATAARKIQECKSTFLLWLDRPRCRLDICTWKGAPAANPSLLLLLLLLLHVGSIERVTQPCSAYCTWRPHISAGRHFAPSHRHHAVRAATSATLCCAAACATTTSAMGAALEATLDAAPPAGRPAAGAPRGAGARRGRGRVDCASGAGGAAGGGGGCRGERGAPGGDSSGGGFTGSNAAGAPTPQAAPASRRGRAYWLRACAAQAAIPQPVLPPRFNRPHAPLPPPHGTHVPAASRACAAAIDESGSILRCARKTVWGHCGPDHQRAQLPLLPHRANV